MNAEEHRRIAYEALCKIQKVLHDDDGDMSDLQYFEAFMEIESQATIARMAMRRVVDLERGAQ